MVAIIRVIRAIRAPKNSNHAKQELHTQPGIG